MSSTAPVRKGILISGYYGFGNAGDEAVLAAMLQEFREHHTEPIAVLSGNPHETETMHGVCAVNRNDVKAVWSQMRRAKLLLSGGGSLFQDATSVRSVVFYYGVLQLARLAKLPFMVFAQGIGPLNSPVSRKMVASSFNHAKAITVRDEGSQKLLEQTGVRIPIEVTADPVFALNPAPSSRTAEILQSEKAPDGEFIGVALRPWPGMEDKAPMVAAALDEVGQKTGLPVVFIAMQPERDMPLSETIASLMKTRASVIRGCYTPVEVMSLFGRARLVLAMRLHALIFAAIQGIPIAGISYDPKVDEILKQMGLSPVCSVSGISPDRIADSILSLHQNHRQSSDAIRERSFQLKKAASRNTEIALSLL